MIIRQNLTEIRLTLTQGATVSGLNAEIAARQAGDTVLQTAINTEVTNRTNAVSAEASTRAAADIFLQNNIDSEASARVTGDNTLSGQITALQNRVSTLESIPPTLSMTAFSAKEKGTSFTPSITGTVTLNDGTITQIRVKQGSIVLNTSTAANISFTSTAITTNTTYTIEVDYSLPGGGSGMLTASQTVSFFAPSYYGSGAAGLNETQIKTLTKVLRSSRAASNLSYNLSGNRPYHVYPKSYGLVTLIRDQNLFDVTAGFTISELTFTLASGASEDMYVVMGNDNVTANPFLLSFS